MLLVLLVLTKPNLVVLCICAVDYKSMVKISGELRHIIGFRWGQFVFKYSGVWTLSK